MTIPKPQKRHFVEEPEAERTASDSDDEESAGEDDDDESDIVGLSLKMPKVTMPYDQVTTAGSSTSVVFYDEEEAVGPQKPVPEVMELLNPLSGSKIRTISNEVMIMWHVLA